MRRLGVIVVAIAAIASGLLILTGSGDDAVSAAPPPSLTEQLNLGVVAIDARIGNERVHSSGTVIDPRAGLVVTSAYTVWGATSLRLTTGLGVLHGRVVARAPCAGLAVVEIQPRVPGLVALEPAEGPPPASEPLAAVGRRESGADAGVRSLVTIPTRATGPAAPARFEPGLPPLPEAIPLDGAVVPESSGGPVVDSSGALVGMAVARAGGADAVAVPWSAIEDRLAELEVDERRIYVGWRSYYRCAPALHAHALREHPGYKPIDAVINVPVPATRLPGTEELDSQ